MISIKSDVDKVLSTAFKDTIRTLKDQKSELLDYLRVANTVLDTTDDIEHKKRREAVRKLSVIDKSVSELKLLSKRYSFQ